MSMSTSETIWLLLFIISTTPITECQLNEWMRKTGTNGEDIWRSTSDFIPVDSQSFGNIKLGEIMSMEFDFTFWGRTNYPQPGFYEMFFRVGYDASVGRGCGGEGARYPSFWLTNNADTMHVSVSSGTNCQPFQSLSDYGTLTIGTTYHINIEFNNTQLLVTVNHDWNKIWNRERIPKIHLGDPVPIWFMSNKYAGDFNIGNATFSNIILKSNIFTVAPTYAPTYSTANPSIAPTNVPSVTPTNVLEGIISESTTVSQENGTFMDGKNSLMDTTMVGVVIAVIAGSCCVLCGIVILCKRRNKIDKFQSETDNGMGKNSYRKQQQIEMKNVPSHTVENVQSHSHVSKPKEVGVIYIRGEHDYDGTGSPIFTPDGVIKNNILAIDDNLEEYLSPAQKEELYSTPKGLDTGDELEEDNLYDDHEYLSKAQCEEMRKQKNITLGGDDSGDSNVALVDDDKTSDDDIVLNMRTDGYIGAGEMCDNDDNDGSSSSEMSDAPMGNKLTIGARDDNDEYEHQHEYDDSLSELNESDGHLVTMQ